MVKLRLTRLGRKKRPFYRIVAIDSRKQRDGAFLERLGYFDPIASGESTKLVLDSENIMKWLLKGAQPSETVKNILSKEGIMLKYDMLKRHKTEKVEKTGMNGKKTVKYLAVKDENGNPIKKFTDAEVEEAYNNWLVEKEKRANAPEKKTTKLSKKAKAKIEADKLAAQDAKAAKIEADKVAAEEAKAKVEEAKKAEEDAKQAAAAAKEQAEAKAEEAPAEAVEETKTEETPAAE
ncbi:MAG: 30S ribosomal protein S16 [Candidatus Delongbacteria bacterium]|nr:30S ribosomal protein S16 [Candidatus Delongbacteria bacterium]